MQIKDLQLKRALRSVLIVLLLSVVGVEKMYAQNANYSFEIKQRTDSVQTQARYVSTMPTNRNVILETFSGRWCMYCPDGDNVANGITAAHSNRVWRVDYHSGSNSTTYPNLNTSFASTIWNAFHGHWIPSGMANRSTTSAQEREDWSALTNEQLNQSAECNIGGIVVVNPETRTATITVEVYYTDNSTHGQNYLTIAMLQNHIIGSQSGSGNYYVFNHIFRDMVTSSWGDAISPTTQGTLITRTYTYQIPETIGLPDGVDVDLDDIYFLAWVSEQYQGAPTRPILTGCKLDMVQGSDEPIFPIIKSVVQNEEISCSHEKIIKVCIQNGGTETLTSMTIETVLQDSTYYTNWEGPMIQYAKDTIEIPLEVPFGDHIANVTITEANGELVEVQSSCGVNCMEWVDFEIEGEEEQLRLELMQDKYGAQITWEFQASNGTVIANGGPYTTLAGGATVTQLHIEFVTVPADECVTFIIHDSGQNGICCSYGHGYYIVKDSQGNVLFGDEDDGGFGAQASHLISVRNGGALPPIGTYFIISSTSNPSDGGFTSGQGIYAFGETCTLVATPAIGYHFVNWTKNGNIVSTNPNYSFTVVESNDYVANFEAIPITQTVQLSAGTNWFSTYLDITLDDLKAALVAAAAPNTTIMIKNATQSAVYSRGRWNGTLDWDVAKRYNIKVASACELTLEGTPIDPSEHPVTIAGGGMATWIGFPLGESMTLTNAFAGFAQNGDMVKSQYGNAVYSRDHWNGGLYLEPGKGYLYISAPTAADRTLTFPTSAK